MRDNWTYKDIFQFHDRVRMALGAVSEATLPDDYIDYPEKAPFAEATIKSRVPLWKDLDAEKFKIFESVIVYQTASFFESIVANKYVKKKEIPTIKLEYGKEANFDISDKSLSDWVDYLVATLNGNEIGSPFFGFRVTKGNVLEEGGA